MLAFLKYSVDVLLYSSLIWDLAPKTILEFGSLQGGSGLWYADQLEAQHKDGEVHSFDVCRKCVHPSATHPRLHFHEVDLFDISTLDTELPPVFAGTWSEVQAEAKRATDAISGTVPDGSGGGLQSPAPASGGPAGGIIVDGL